MVCWEKVMERVKKLLESKNDQYGRLDTNPVHCWLSEKFPDFRLASAVKHILSYKNTKRELELEKAISYLVLEYMDVIEKESGGEGFVDYGEWF